MLCQNGATSSHPSLCPLHSSALTWTQWVFLIFHATGPRVRGKMHVLFLFGEQKEGILPEEVHGQVERDQQQEGGDAEEGGGEHVVSDRESSDSDDGFTNVLDPLSRQAKELIANECQVLHSACHVSLVGLSSFVPVAPLQAFWFLASRRLHRLLRPASLQAARK